MYGMLGSRGGREDVRVGQPGGDLDLAKEPLGTEGLHQLRSQHLDRDATVVFEILGQVYDGHPATPELRLDSITGTERTLNITQEIGHELGSVGLAPVVSGWRTAAGAECRLAKLPCTLPGATATPTLIRGYPS